MTITSMDPDGRPVMCMNQAFGDLYINNIELGWCLMLGLKRSGSMGHMETRNSQDLMKDSTYGDVAPWYRHYIGAIGEKAYSIMTGYPVDEVIVELTFLMGIRSSVAA
jgi:hypothetical protein